MAAPLAADPAHTEGQEQQGDHRILDVKSNGPPGGHLSRVLDAPSGGGLAELFRRLSRAHEHGYINALQLFRKASDVPKSHGIPDMTQILPKRRQKAQRHRKGNRKTRGAPILSKAAMNWLTLVVAIR
jgi:hypothetical protein